MYAIYLCSLSKNAIKVSFEEKFTFCMNSVKKKIVYKQLLKSRPKKRLQNAAYPLMTKGRIIVKLKTQNQTAKEHL